MADVEHAVDSLVRALDGGRTPTREAVDAVRAQLNQLPRADGSISSWRLAELDAAMQDVVRRALPRSAPQLVVVPEQRRREPLAVAHDGADLDERFAALRSRVDALHDLVEAGGRPSSDVFDELDDALVAHRRQADGPEVRQMIDDVRGFHRAVLAASRTSAASRLASSQIGRGFWGRPLGERRNRVRRRSVSAHQGSGSAQSLGGPSATAAERARLAAEAERLRDRAARFAAAVPRGRVLPLQETDRLFLHFKSLRPYLNRETQALNDAAVRLLVDAVTEVRARRP